MRLSTIYLIGIGYTVFTDFFFKYQIFFYDVITIGIITIQREFVGKIMTSILVVVNL